MSKWCRAKESSRETGESRNLRERRGNGQLSLNRYSRCLKINHLFLFSSRSLGLCRLKSGVRKRGRHVCTCVYEYIISPIHVHTDRFDSRWIPPKRMILEIITSLMKHSGKGKKQEIRLTKMSAVFRDCNSKRRLERLLSILHSQA